MKWNFARNFFGLLLLPVLYMHSPCTENAFPVLQHGEGCGNFSSAPLSEAEYQGARAVIERALFDQNLSHCEFAHEVACLDWKTGRNGGGISAFNMAQRFCDDKIMAKRGEIASALARKEYGEAFAAWSRNALGDSRDSMALVEYEPAVFSGLSISGFAYHGPEKYNLRKINQFTYGSSVLSLFPGWAFLRIGESKKAASHFALTTLFASACTYFAWQGLKGGSKDIRMTAAMDFTLVFSLFFQRYYWGGIREAQRLAEVKKRSSDQDRIERIWEGLDPFKLPFQSTAPSLSEP